MEKVFSSINTMVYHTIDLTGAEDIAVPELQEHDAEFNLLEQTEQLILGGAQEVEKAGNQNIILVLGGTGCGKSTTINYLAGCHMREQFDEETGDVTIGCDNPVAEIGEGSKSKTLYPHVVDFLTNYQNMNMKLCDTAGFSDNRGPAYDICASLTLGQVFEKSSGIVGVIVILQEANILDSRLTEMINVMRQLNRCLNPDNFSDSLIFFITKNFNGRTEKQIYKIIQKKYQDFKGRQDEDFQKIQWIFEAFLRDEGANIHVCNPLDEDKRDILINAVLNLKLVTDKTSAFNYPISPESRITVTKLLGKLKMGLADQVQKMIRAYLNDFTAAIQKDQTMEALDLKLSTVEALDCKVASSCKATVMEFKDDFLAVSDSKCFGSETNTAVKELKESLTEIDGLLHFNSEDYDKPMISQAVLEGLREELVGLRHSIYLKKTDLLLQTLHRLLMSYEIQSHVWEDEVRKTYPSLLNRNQIELQASNLKLLGSYLSDNDRQSFEQTVNQFLQMATKDPANREQYLARLTGCLRSCVLQPFSLPATASEMKEKELAIKALEGSFAISQVMKALKTMANPQSETIWFIAKDTIYLDGVIDNDFAGGKNIVIACKNLVVGSNAQINTSGKSSSCTGGAVMGPTSYQAVAGTNGGRAGNIHLLVTGEISGYELILVANGGNGGPGSNGVDGAVGASGKDMADAGFAHPIGYDEGILNRGIPGTPGENGKDGSPAGAGGFGGSKGRLILLPTKEKYMSKIRFTAEEGVDGSDGRPGAGGMGGQGGTNGYDALAYSVEPLSPNQYWRGYITGWSMKFKFFTYELKIEGTATEGKTGGPGKTRAAQGLPGKSGVVVPNPVGKLPMLAPVPDQFIKDRYCSYLGEEINGD